MKNTKLKMLAALVSSSLLISGCGDSSSLNQLDTSNPGAPGSGNAENGNSGDENPFVGTSSISGAISLSSLSGSDANAVNGATAQFKQMSAANVRALDATSNAIVKLYVVGSNGELQDTGIDCSFDKQSDDNGNPRYSCPNVADGKQYVVKYLRLLEGNRALEMKVNVEVPEGAPSAEGGEISPESTVVVDTIINAILTATEGKNIDPEVVNDIVKSVKQAVINLVRSGAVQIPSMIVDAPKDASGNYISDVTRLKSGDDVDYGTNEQLQSAAGNLLSDESVANEVDAVKVEIGVRELERIDSSSEAGKRRLVKRVFSEMLDGDVPDFIARFFGDRFVQGDMKSIGDLFAAISAGLRIDPRLQIEPTAITRGGALSAFQLKLAEIHELMGKKTAGTMTDEEKKAFREIPSVIPALFPADVWKDKDIVEGDELNVPQGIAFVVFVTDVYIPDVLKDQGNDPDSLVSAEEGEGGRVEVEMQDPVNFDPMHFDPAYADSGNGRPGLMQLYGFFKPENLASLEGVEISWLDIMPDKAWIPNPDGVGGGEVDMLRANVCVSDLSKMAQMLTPRAVGNDDLTVELTYPTGSGMTATVELMSEADLHMPPPGEMPPEGQGPEGGNGPGFESCFVLDPWRKAQMSSGAEGGPVQLTESDVISDFVSGTYKVEVKRAGSVVASREFRQKVLVGMSDVRPHLTSPNGMPEWPRECEGQPECPEWETLQRQWQANGGITTFAINEDVDDNGVPDKAKVTLSWEKPKVDLPDGVKIAYSLNIGLDRGCDTSGCNWEPIYDTWRDNRKLFGTSFTLPVLLDRVEFGQGTYNANVCALFIDTETGREIGRGSCGWAQFQVGDPLDMNATFTITGTLPSGVDASWKVALIKESFNPDLLVAQWQREVVQLAIIANGTYSLTPKIGDYLDSSGAHFQIVLFQDDNNDGQPDPTEQVFWPGGEESVRFETWGGVLRHVKEKMSSDGEFERHETVITGGEEVTGPDFTSMPTDPGPGGNGPGTPGGGNPA